MMQGLRRAGRIVSGIFFPLALLVFLSTYMIMDFVKPENFGPVLSNILLQSPQGEQIIQSIQAVRDECESKDSVSIELGGENRTISCDDIRGKSDNEIITAVVLEAASEGATVPEGIFAGQSGGGELNKIFMYSLIAVVSLGAILFVSGRNWFERLSPFGKTFVGTAAIFLLFIFAAPRVINQVLPAEISSMAGPIVESIGQSQIMIYISMLIAGIGMWSIAYALKNRKSGKARA